MEKGKVDNIIELALNQLVKPDISGALNILDEASRANPNQIKLINLKADCYYLLGDFFQAKQSWEKVLEIESQNKSALSKLEKFNSPAFQFWLKRYYQAIEEIENKDFLVAQNNLLELIQENDKFISLYQLLGLTYLALNDEKNALKVWGQGLKLDISNPELIRYINTPKKGIKKPKFIAKETENNNEPKNNILYIVSGFCIMLLLLQMSYSLSSEEDYKATINNLQAKISSLNEQLTKKDVPVINVASNEEDNLVIELFNNEGSSYDIEKEKEYYQKGYQAYKAKDYKTAISNLGVVVSIASKSYINREGLYYLALSYYVSEDYDNAEIYYLKYLGEFPDTNYTDESLYYLGCVYYYKNDIAQAKSMLEKLDVYDPQSGYKSTELYIKIKNITL